MLFVLNSAGNFHARGHGLHSLGDVNQDELERKRLKTLEHQVSSLVVIHNSVHYYQCVFDIKGHTVEQASNHLFAEHLTFTLVLANIYFVGVI